MIISASRRTDIPAFFPEWFMNRIREGYVLARNPMNYHHVSKINLSPDIVDCIVFWTKDPTRLIRQLPEISSMGYQYYFQFTLNAYEKEIEPSLPSLKYRIDTLQSLARKIERSRVVWRYDPIFISDKYTVLWHKKQFEYLSSTLKNSTERCVISFLDMYGSVQNNLAGTGAREPSEEEMKLLAESFAASAGKNEIRLQTCAEKIDLEKYGIEHGCCIDAGMISEITGVQLDVKKDKTQRKECGCVESIDIGQYDTCRHGCRYCYAMHSAGVTGYGAQKNDPISPLLIGNIEDGDKITEREIKSFKKTSEQLSLFGTEIK